LKKYQVIFIPGPGIKDLKKEILKNGSKDINHGKRTYKNIKTNYPMVQKTD
tara:strand:+ start:201 stop:353 length:153 start_codon:yes stop_codon:yes gene_type:complete